ncbi:MULTISPECIES: hypothetical protein [unclassified Acinetobacter]|uniref:hypothetical protein n=1 Tax=unclassified Acinetobacter TaxID=196816 RepID=UPI002575A761|nr:MULTISPECIES: hypothetical protein [unclassified Acinetobacter]MDM1764604.1 hypothetical protein [Acinetobacter sp. 226-1]MDM1768600.1 hypothetical protein [Acinetobacter sp. 226-4]
MALKVAIKESKEISLWREYKDKEGKVLARFKIRGIEHQAYQVALERAQNQIVSKGYDVSKASVDDKVWYQLTMEAAACHLIEDWEGIEFEEGGVVREQPYSEENATKLFHMGDLGWQIWGFVKSEAEKIQKEANQVKEEVLGKSESSTTGKPYTVSSPTTKKSNAKRSTSK